MQAQFVAAPPTQYQVYSRFVSPPPKWGNYANAVAIIAAATGAIVGISSGAVSHSFPTAMVGVGLFGVGALSFMAALSSVPNSELIIAERQV